MITLKVGGLGVGSSQQQAEIDTTGSWPCIHSCLHN